MFILQTTIAVLIAFLAVLAYNKIQNSLAKGRSRRKDVESPASPSLSAINEPKSPLVSDGPERLEALEKVAADKEMEEHKQLYFKLHNLEYHPEILPECYQLLICLLSETLASALKDPSSGILSVSTFSRENLCAFLKAKDVDVTDRYEAYIQRRRAKGPREMFSDEAEAKWWLKQAAPVKYVDGAWLGHINKISTPFKYRHITKNAWQVMSEELGDGDLMKNHVHVYRELMAFIHAGLPEADKKDFIHPGHELNEARCWKAALAQLLISLFPHEFLPEALGFNMAYESLPLHLLKTVKELKELRLDPYYFELHISIDNADSGHAAMAMETAIAYIEMVAQEEGEKAAQSAWRRVQAGYILAEGLPTTPESPSLKINKAPEVAFPQDDTERELLEVFAAKAPVAHKIHCNSHLKIGRRSLVDWLEPSAFKDAKWQMEFLHDLSNCRPWVIKGDSEKSCLVREMSWGGKMFGSFMQSEVEIVKRWIDELALPAKPKMPEQDGKPYFQFVDRDFEPFQEHQNVLTDYPVLYNMPIPVHVGQISPSLDIGSSLVEIDWGNFSIRNFLTLWFTSLSLLDSLPSVPVRASDAFGSALIRVLRAQTGFSHEGPGVAGIDEVRRTDNKQAIGLVELGIEMCERAGLGHLTNLEEAVDLGDRETKEVAKWVVALGMMWLEKRDFLVGMTYAWMEMHFFIAKSGQEELLISTRGRNILEKIAKRERDGLEVCKFEIEKDSQRYEDFCKGLQVTRFKIRRMCKVYA